MSKHDTKYTEGEREINRKHLSNFGLNPYATEILVRSYKQHCAPFPVIFDYYIEVTDRGFCHVMVELRTPGYVGNTKGDANLLDRLALRMFCRSYFEEVSPYPVDFFMEGAEVHIHTPGVSDQEKKNIARNIFDPTK